MAKPKLKSAAKKATSHAGGDARHLGKSVIDSAQQIWLAGLGAFAKAQQEGSKLFEALVKEGTSLEAKTRKFTQSKVDEARGNVESTLGQVRERSQETWDKLEKVFEDRVSRSLKRLGIPGQADIKRLEARIDELARGGKKQSPVRKVAAKRGAK
ncbi:phasin family protein [Dokdonella sp.]|uniref:phasin family protein n=1 Tax=Dokdonella sp. TaxID=2291710 RepID=UPI0025BCE216|nr:phasin family protein [Dokdonella sp.]MBX3688944.1 phasin family protein [Dokdonella sp.]